MKKTIIKASGLVIGANILFGLIAVLTCYTFLNIETDMAPCLIFVFLAVQVMFFVLRARDKDHAVWARTMLGLETAIICAEAIILALINDGELGWVVFYIPVIVSGVFFVLPILTAFGLALASFIKRSGLDK